MLPQKYFRRIGVDCDDVLVDFMGGLCEWHNQNYGTQLTREKFRDGSTLSSVAVLPNEEGIGRVMQYVGLLNKCESGPLIEIPGAREALDYIRWGGFNLALVTARGKDSEEATFAEMRCKFPGIFEEIYFSRNKTFNRARGRSKARICLDERLDVLIEDAPENAIECANAGIYVLLFDQPWNQKCPEHPKIKRVRGWDEVAFSTSIEYDPTEIRTQDPRLSYLRKPRFP